VSGTLSGHGGSWRDHVADRFERFLRLALLHIAYDGVDEHDRQDDGGVDGMVEKRRGERRRQKKVDQSVVEMLEEAQNRMRPRGRRQCVRPPPSPASLHLLNIKPVRARIEPREHIFHLDFVPGNDHGRSNLGRRRLNSRH
jgi:hypothetical protein